MQRTRLFTRAEGAFALSLPRDAGAWAVSGLLACFLLGASVVILLYPKPPVWDQARLLQARFEAPFHPSPPFGMSAQLLVVALRTLLPEAVPLPQALRIFAMAFWAGSACWLAQAMLRRRSHQALLVLLLFTSQYPFLWLSSELIAGGLLCLALAAWMRAAPPWGVGVLLALLALAKPDLVAVALLLLGLFAWRARHEAPALAAGFGGALLVLLLPGLVWFGPGYLTDYGGGGGRGFASFGQHFAALVAPLQLAPAPDPWARPQPYLERVFPGARSMLDVVSAPGLPYLDFVALSLARGVRRVGWLFQWGWLAAVLLALGRRRAGLRLDAREQALLLCFAGCASFVLFAYPHVRYFARYYPLFWILVLGSMERLEGVADPLARRGCRIGAAVAIALAVVRSVERASVGVAAAPHLSQYWFPD